jgi:uncharacterized membrane protein
MPLAITGYEFSLWIHITAVMVGFGATFAEALMFPVALRLDPRHLPYVHRLQLAINQYLATPALVIVLATGFFQVADGDWKLGKFWLSASILILIVIGGLLGGYFIPADRRLGPMVEREIAAAGDPPSRGAGGPVTLSDEYQAQAKRQGAIGALTGVLLVIVIFLMVTKPGV